MLKLKTPIGLVNRNITSKSVDGFFNRINGNYELINSSIDPEDLLHVYTQPPEVFLAEGDTTNIFNSNLNVENKQIQKLEILNNLINRILLSDNASFTYQDKVYISSIFHKLGIKDEHNFLSRVYSLIDETKLTYVQNKTLLESLDEIKKINNYINNNNVTQKKDDFDKAIEEEESTSISLHQSIFERLNFSEMVKFINQMSTNPVSNVNVSYNEIIGAENLRIAEHLVLQDLSNQITNTEAPMVFNHENLYEENIETEEEIDKSQVISNLSKAMLLSYIDNVYQSRVRSINEGENRWFMTTRNLYQSVENTVKRYTQNLTQPISNELIKVFHENELSNFVELKNRIDFILNMRSESILEGDEINQETANIIEGINAINQQIANISQGNDEVTNISNVQLKHLINALSSGENAQVVQEELQNIINAISENETNISKTQSSQIELLNETLNNAQTSYTDNRVANQNVQMTNVSVSEDTEISEEQQIINALNQIEQRNIENQNQYIRALQNLEKIKDSTPRKISSVSRQKAESLAALSDPGELILQYREEAKRDAEEERVLDQKLIEQLPADVQRYVQIIDRFLVNPTPEDRRLLGTDPLASLNRDILETEQQKLQMAHRMRETTVTPVVIDNAEELIENITNSHVISKDINESVTESVKKVSFVHKESVQIDEEEINERFEQLKNERNETTTVTNQVNETTQVINKTEVTKEVIENVIGSEQMVRMVSDNVMDQLNNLSDQVYQKLEKRLINEKRRRGL